MEAEVARAGRPVAGGLGVGVSGGSAYQPRRRRIGRSDDARCRNRYGEEIVMGVRHLPDQCLDRRAFEQLDPRFDPEPPDTLRGSFESGSLQRPQLAALFT